MDLPFLFRRLIRKLPLPVRLFLSRAWSGPGIFAQRHMLANNTRVTLYTDDASLAPSYAPRESLRAHLGKRAVRASLIAPVKNEATNARAWCESITRQTRLPDEIIVTDAGSTDGTLDILRDFSDSSSIPFHVIVEPGCNIARARNLAIAQATHPIITATDFGCLPQNDWLENIVAPFEANAETRVVAGLYAPVDSRRHAKWRGFSIYPILPRINPRIFLPSSRSIAFTLDSWRAVGGYPEWLTHSGEDTWFDRELQRIGGEWAFVPQAIVEWHTPENFSEYGRKVFNWSMGDGESGLHAGFYWRYALQLTATLGGTFALMALALWLRASALVTIWLALIAVIWVAGVLVASHATGVAPLIFLPEVILKLFAVAGFVVGARGRDVALQRRMALTRGMFFILSGVPIDDTGGGARCTQIALELLQQNFAVTFIHKFPKYESRDLHLKIGHPNLFHFSLAEFNWEQFAREQGQWLDAKLLAVLIEFPLSDFLPLIRQIKSHRGVVIYDLLDAWDTALGGKWYSHETENEIIGASQVLVATVPTLAECLSAQSSRNVVLLPNAVDRHLFDPRKLYPRPADLPSADWIAIYVGALWGEWFDWDLLVEIARQNPHAAVVVIGEYQGQCPVHLPNLHFLGLKVQKELPAFLAHSHVAILPWKINRITQATSPLKVYEYLSMHKPVVAPNIAPLRGLPGVWCASNKEEFIARLNEARAKAFPSAAVTRFIELNNWQVRVENLIAAIEQAHKEESVGTI